MKTALRGHRFSNDDEVKESAFMASGAAKNIIFSGDIQCNALMDKCIECIERQGNMSVET
jgi:hypothetical protein